MASDLIEDFVRATETGLAPERFRRWTIISVISAVLNRNVWTSIRKNRSLLPNLYVMLIAEPGAGKGEAIRLSRHLLTTQLEVDLGPSSITFEALIRHLAERGSEDKKALFENAQKSTMFLGLLEWGVFLREPKSDDMALLAQIFDNEPVERETIGRGTDYAENVYMTILAGCTPAWFAKGFPPNSYEEGLPTRFLFIHDKVPNVSAGPDYISEPTETADENVVGPLFHARLKRISRLTGFVGWDLGALDFLNDLRRTNFDPRPEDPMLTGYCTRRPLHLAKIALIVAVAQHPEVSIIHMEDVKRAWEIMLEAEPSMPAALAQAGGNEYQARMDAIAKFVLSEYKGRGKPVEEWRVLTTLGRLVPPMLVKTIIDTMIASKALRVVEGTTVPNRQLMPGVGK